MRIYKITFSIALLSLLNSCGNNSNLEEVMIPDPEVTSTKDIGSPKDVEITDGNFDLTVLKFEYDEYKPFIDAKTMELHYATYYVKITEKLNKAIEETSYKESKIVPMLKSLKSSERELEELAVDYYNHSFFFSILGKENYNNPKGQLMEQITKDFGSYTALKSEFTTLARANTNGWIWLIQNKSGGLNLVHSSNLTNPILPSFIQKGIPILALDLNEHAYFLKYNFNKNDYIFNFFKAINWEVVEQNFSDNSTIEQ